MKPISVLLIAVALAAGQVYAAAPTTQPAPATQPSAQTQRLAHYVKAIGQAADVSVALGTYATAESIFPHNPQLQEAFVRRAVELGRPGIAYTAATALARAQGDNGLAWAVLASGNVERGRMVEALTYIVEAASDAPDDPFVQRTAGVLMAWYDLHSTEVALPRATQSALMQARDRLSGMSAYQKAYRDAQKSFAINLMLRSAPYVAGPSTYNPPASYPPPSYSYPPPAYYYPAPGPRASRFGYSVYPYVVGPQRFGEFPEMRRRSAGRPGRQRFARPRGNDLRFERFRRR